MHGIILVCVYSQLCILFMGDHMCIACSHMQYSEDRICLTRMLLYYEIVHIHIHVHKQSTESYPPHLTGPRCNNEAGKEAGRFR